MGIATQVAPIRIGVLIDFVLPEPSHWDVRSDFLDAARITFDDATASGRLDRPVELVIREVEGLPRGTVKAVIDAYGELADEGCLGVFGPMISESAVPLREAIEERFRIPAISWCGADEWHGEWTFSLSNGSLTDEPYVIANLLAQRGLRRAAVSYERSLIGQKYLASFRDACRVEGITIVGEAADRAERGGRDRCRQRAARRRSRRHRAPRIRARRGRRERRARRAELGPAALHGNVVGERLHERRDLPRPPRLDRSRSVRRGQSGGAGVPRSLRGRTGRRPGYFSPIYGHDVAQAFVAALANAEPLSPRGVMEALERVKMLPAACGEAGTRISFGNWTRRGWMGAGYLIAREVTPDFQSTVFRGRLGARTR